MEIVASKGLLPTNIDEALKLCDVLAKSQIIPKDFIGKPSDIFVAVNWGIEIGLSPMQSLQSIAVINGRPNIWGDAALALVRGSGKLELIEETQTETQATCRIKRKGEPEAVYTFSKTDAEKAGLWDTRTTVESYGKQIKNPAPWHRYPKRMMQMRARSFALRDIFTDVLKGIGIAEEAKDQETFTEEIHTEAIAPIDPLASIPAPEETEVEVFLEGEEVVTVDEITAIYKSTPAELKPKVLAQLDDGWRDAGPEDLAIYKDRIERVLNGLDH